MDIDTEGPVANAVVKVARILTGPQHVGRAIDGPGGTTDESGFFSFAAEVPADWVQLVLKSSRDGYEGQGDGWFGPSANHAAHLPMYRTVAIRPGQSLDLRVALASCFMDGIPCRRVTVEAPPGELVDLAVSATDSAAQIGLDGRAETHGPVSPRWLRQLTVSGRADVWVYGVTPSSKLPVRSDLTLTATRH